MARLVASKRQWKYPLHLEKEYERQLKRYARQLKLIEKEEISYIKSLLELYRVDSESRQDGIVDDVTRMANRIKNKFYSFFSESRILSDVRGMLNKINVFNKKQADNSFKGFAVDVFTREPDIREAANIWTSENVKLIKSLVDTDVDRLASIVLNGVQNGTPTKQVAEEIQKLTGTTTKRAQLIAVDQIGKLNGALTRQRQLAAGITHFKWQTMQDSRVREEHSERNQKIYPWAYQFSDGYPGQPIRCRCVAQPVIDLDKF